MSQNDSMELWNSGPWTDAYEFGEKLGDGGQGFTFRAVCKRDQLPIAIKVLRSDRDTPKSRRRMFREVNALRSLSKTNANVPGFIESNIGEAIDNKSLRPFVVMDYIPGKTLLKAQQQCGPLSIQDAIDFANLVLDTVEVAHSEDTTHRDIKPQNIVLKSDDYSSPYLIDFGLSFNRVLDLEDGLTWVRETIGNRFLTLPEQEQTGSELKHEFASDLTLISGILFYLLTDSFPEYLSPDIKNSPHHRHHGTMESQCGENLQFLMQFFDRGFQYDVVRRFRSSGELRDRLNRLKDQAVGKMPAIDPFSVAAEIKDFVASQNRDFQLDAIEERVRESLKGLQNHVAKIAKTRESLAPITLEAERQTFRQRKFRELEVIREPILMFWVSIPKYYKRLSACRYFLAADGEEISVIFQEAYSEGRNKKQWLELLVESREETLLSFYEWNETHDEFIKRHFENWFDRASRQLISE